MLCVTGKETDLAFLTKRISSVVAPGRLCEVRLDALSPLDEDAFALLRRFAPMLVVCCRPERQGGSFRGSESDRLRILERAAASGVAFLDVEADVPETALARLRRVKATRLLLSWHHFGDPDPALRLRFEAMSQRGAALLKLAVSIQDAAELIELKKMTARADIPTVLIGMGPAGLLSRVRYTTFGSPWTYVHHDTSESTGPGQLSLTQACEMGLPDAVAHPFLALVGGAQALASPGPRVYNRVLRNRGLPWSYVPVITERAPETFALLQKCGALGTSVTMPHKQAALAFAEPDACSKRVGAANSLRFREKGAEATNTDIEGVREPLREALTQVCPHENTSTLRALVLGAGGAASAALEACSQLGLEVVVAARRPEEARTRLGAHVTVIPWQERLACASQLLVNATPLDGAPQQACWSESSPLNQKIVFDLALTGKPSRLLERAQQSGAVTLGPLEMWIHQGAKQMTWITDEPFSPQELREHLL